MQELVVLPLEKLIMLFVDGKITKELVPKKSLKCRQKSGKTELTYRLGKYRKNAGFRTNVTSFGKVAFKSALFNNVFMSVTEQKTLIQKMLTGDIQNLSSDNAAFREKYMAFPVLTKFRVTCKKG